MISENNKLDRNTLDKIKNQAKPKKREK